MMSFRLVHSVSEVKSLMRHRLNTVLHRTSDGDISTYLIFIISFALNEAEEVKVLT